MSDAVLTKAKSPIGRPTTGRAAQIKANVMTATMATFAEKGMDFSMDEVADRAGVSKQAIYRRWRSKLDLIIETVETLIEEEVDRERMREPSADPVACLRALAWRAFADGQATYNRVSVFVQVESLRSKRLRDRMIYWQARSREVYRLRLIEIEMAGRRAKGDINLQAELLMDLLSSAAGRMVLAQDASGEEQRLCFEQRWSVFEAVAIC